MVRYPSQAWPEVVTLRAVIHELQRRAGPEPVEAQSLVTRVADRLAPVDGRIRCLAALAWELADLHGRGIVYGIVQPASVRLDHEGRPKLIGVNDEPRELVWMDTPLVHQRSRDPRCSQHIDQFCFGLTAYEFLSLENPFTRASQEETLEALRRAQRRDLSSSVPGISADVARVVHHVLALDPGNRYSSTATMAEDLAAASEGRSISLDSPWRWLRTAVRWLGSGWDCRG